MAWCGWRRWRPMPMVAIHPTSVMASLTYESLPASRTNGRFDIRCVFRQLTALRVYSTRPLLISLAWRFRCVFRQLRCAALRVRYTRTLHFGRRPLHDPPAHSSACILLHAPLRSAWLGACLVMASACLAVCKSMGGMLGSARGVRRRMWAVLPAALSHDNSSPWSSRFPACFNVRE